MDTQEFQGEDVEYTLPPEYLEKVFSKIKISDRLLGEKFFWQKMTLALMVQNNLLMEKMCNLMAIASGLTPADIPDDIGLDNESVKSAVGKSVKCPKCGKQVVPNGLGYCPNKECKADLRKLIMELNQD